MTDKPARVLHIFSGMNRGGAETMMMNLYRKMDRTKVQFDFLTHRNDPCAYDEEILALGGRLFYVPSIGSTNPITFVKQVKRVIQEKGPFAAVHAHTDFQSGFIALAARLAGVPVRICHSHSTSWRGRSSGLGKVQMFVFRRLITANATALCACGEEAGRFLFGKQKDVRLLPNGIDLDLFAGGRADIESEKRKRGIAAGRLVIGHIGRFTEEKNHEFLLRLAADMKERGIGLQLILAGDGPLRTDMEKLAEKLGLDGAVRFIGVEDRVHDLLKTLDVFVMPSLYEGLPVTLVEAQASGVPCVISDGITEEADAGLGLVKRLSLKEPLEQWASAILRAAEAPKPGRARIKETLGRLGYDAGENAGAVMKLYNMNCEKEQ
ncbi:glycosyltransferase family 1 protein [Bacillus siamensis]|uniref:Glycosyltransferase family 1 protein n=1 Tax=Bacillus siamensis TaxID=659243 RepID=A0AAI8HKY0_9BACI|nr:MULTISPECIES: glycosyltransferase family 1 protein [Bacillus]AME07341.1 glycosyl transferase [Bacillus sp. SDLI1]AUJ75922.1 glycosyltransferase family 1 protein [Bacillus siamensis]UUA83703.1 glycosyltransferase family 1 protein [Bacillus siamensis]